MTIGLKIVDKQLEEGDIGWRGTHQSIFNAEEEDDDEEDEEEEEEEKRKGRYTPL